MLVYCETEMGTFWIEAVSICDDIEDLIVTDTLGKVHRFEGASASNGDSYMVNGKLPPKLTVTAMSASLSA